MPTRHSASFGQSGTKNRSALHAAVNLRPNLLDVPNVIPMMRSRLGAVNLHSYRCVVLHKKKDLILPLTGAPMCQWELRNTPWIRPWDHRPTFTVQNFYG